MSSPPDSLGPYEIIREIARSNDIVYEAFDSGTNRRVAVKQLSIPVGSSDPQTQDRIARFQREAKAVGSLNHPNIMTVYSFSQDAGRWYLAMEFLDGVTLRKEIDSRGTIEVERAIEIAKETLAGLGHAHQNGVIHRDIKPDNIQIVSSGQVKITDFGIARLTFDRNITLDGQVFGTPSYMSPEQVVGKEIDQRSDIFSVGVMLYEMIAGVKPFVGDSVVTITYNIVNTSITQPPTIPNAVWTVVRQAIDKVPANRYDSAQSMITALDEAVKNLHAPQTPVAPWQVGAPATHNPYAPPQAMPQGMPPAVGGYGTALPPVLGSPPPSPYSGFNPYATSAPGMGPGMNAGNPQFPMGGSMPGQMPGQFPGQFPGQYQGQFPGQFPGNLPGGGMTPPMYYPPPPRQPILKPETSAALGRFATIFVTIGLLFLVLGYGFKLLLEGAMNAKPVNRSSVSTSVSRTGAPPVATSPGNSPVTSQPGASTPETIVTEVDPVSVASDAELLSMESTCQSRLEQCERLSGAFAVVMERGDAYQRQRIAQMRRNTVEVLVSRARNDGDRRRQALQLASDLAEPVPELQDWVKSEASKLDSNLVL